MQTDIFTTVAYATSKTVTSAYSNSFSMAVRMLPPRLRNGIYAVYGFVRFADEIVDTFHEYDKEFLLDRFEEDVYLAMRKGISLNPVLQSFQLSARKYNIDNTLIDAFIESMRKDLTRKEYNRQEYLDYIFGSADVVGLMCLKVFVDGCPVKYEALKFEAMKLGSAFQKVNFLRDIKNDVELLDRVYFPDVDLNNFTEKDKQYIINEIENDFKIAYSGIKKLPRAVQPAVFTAYLYYKTLLAKLKNVPPSQIMNRRIRISNSYKLFLMAYSYSSSKLNIGIYHNE